MLATVLPAGLTYLKVLSILACLLIAVGLTQRRRRRIHIPLMLSAFVIDLGIVVYIEWDRGAIASAKARMGPLMIVHICLSVLVLILYAVQIVTGVRKARGRPARRHGTTGLCFCVARFGNLITSFLVT